MHACLSSTFLKPFFALQSRSQKVHLDHAAQATQSLYLRELPFQVCLGPMPCGSLAILDSDLLPKDLDVISLPSSTLPTSWPTFQMWTLSRPSSVTKPGMICFASWNQRLAPRSASTNYVCLSMSTSQKKSSWCLCCHFASRIWWRDCLWQRQQEACAIGISMHVGATWRYTTQKILLVTRKRKAARVRQVSEDEGW